jgi:hypothetical protein
MAHRRKNVNNYEAHVKEPQKEHDRNRGNGPTGELQAESIWGGCEPAPSHHSRPPCGDEPKGITGVAGVGGVIDQQTRHRDYTKFTEGTISAERLEVATSTGLPDNSPNRLCIVDSGAGTSTGPAPAMRNGRRPDTIEYCTDVV